MKTQTVNVTTKHQCVPTLNIDLSVAPDFSGRVVAYFENGKLICDRRLTPDEHVCSVETLIEIAREMGYPMQELK